jgi:hypothetical protein
MIPQPWEIDEVLFRMPRCANETGKWTQLLPVGKFDEYYIQVFLPGPDGTMVLGGIIWYSLDHISSLFRTATAT